jgi:hypothetical protein
VQCRRVSERSRFMWSIAMSVSFPFQLQPDPERERSILISWRSIDFPPPKSPARPPPPPPPPLAAPHCHAMLPRPAAK